jgi:hypothetical protein
MALQTFSYAPDKVIVIVAGVPLTGYGEDNAIEVAPESDLSTSKVGIDGDVTRSISTDRRVTLTVRLMQSSPSNDYLSGLLGIDLITGGRLFPITVQHLTGRDLVVAPQAWLSRRPTLILGREAQEREWAFQTGALAVWIAGGSNFIA